MNTAPIAERVRPAERVAAVDFPAPTPSLTAVPNEMPFASVMTLTVWLGCMVVGIAGLTLGYAAPEKPLAETKTPIQAQIVNVELTQEGLPLAMPAPVTELPAPPELAQPQTLAPAPSLIPVAEPSAAIAFALPVKGATQVVAAEAAAFSRPAGKENRSETASAPAVQQLAFGQGEGKQRAPEYPRRAILERQEGSVRVLFTVGANGRVLAAEVSEPSPWPLLNQSALRVVRDHWRFNPGPVRRYEAPIHFQLRNK